ncbi:MAG: Ig-like domain-containing protein [Gemmatimonadota bacterium]
MTRRLHFFAIASLSLAASGCGGFDFGPPQVATTIQFRPQSLTFTQAGSFDSFLATVYDANGFPIRGIDVAWTSSDITVATVNTNGGVVSVGNGTATITATAGSISGTAEVTVELPVVEIDLVSVSAGGAHTCAIGATRDAYCWGANSYFQLGDGFSLLDRNTPVEVDYNPNMHTVRSEASRWSRRRRSLQQAAHHRQRLRPKYR